MMSPRPSLKSKLWFHLFRVAVQTWWNFNHDRGQNQRKPWVLYHNIVWRTLWPSLCGCCPWSILLRLLLGVAQVLPAGEASSWWLQPQTNLGIEICSLSPFWNGNSQLTSIFPMFFSRFVSQEYGKGSAGLFVSDVWQGGHLELEDFFHEGPFTYLEGAGIADSQAWPCWTSSLPWGCQLECLPIAFPSGRARQATEARSAEGASQDQVFQEQRQKLQGFLAPSLRSPRTSFLPHSVCQAGH